MLTIRESVADDVDAVAVVHARSWQVAYRGLVPDEFLNAIDPAAWADRARNRVDPDRRTLVAVDDTELVGFVSFGPDRKDRQYAEVYAIYVLPDRWGQGAGRALLDAALARIASPVVRLWVAAGNERSQRFYETYGFVNDNAADTYSIGGVELATVRYSLTRGAGER